MRKNREEKTEITAMGLGDFELVVEDQNTQKVKDAIKEPFQ